MSARQIPLGKRVLVRKLETEKVGGIIIPDAEKEEAHSQRCEVVEVSEGSEHHLDTRIAPGAVVFIAKFSGYKIEQDGETLYAVNDEHVLTIERNVEAESVSLTGLPIPHAFQPRTDTNHCGLCGELFRDAAHYAGTSYEQQEGEAHAFVPQARNNDLCSICEGRLEEGKHYPGLNRGSR